MQLPTPARTLTTALALAATMPLAGCPFMGERIGGIPTPTYTPTGGYPYHPPSQGLTLADAYHDAEQYLATQYQGSPQLVSAHSDAVAASGTSQSGWTFVFEVTPSIHCGDCGGPPIAEVGGTPGGRPMASMAATVFSAPPPASPAPSDAPAANPTDPSPVPSHSPSPAPSWAPSPLPSYGPIFAPSPMPYPYPYPSTGPWQPAPNSPEELSLTVDGQGNVLAPRSLPQNSDPTLNFDQTVSVSSILATLASLGSPGQADALDLRVDSQQGPVFAIDRGQPVYGPVRPIDVIPPNCCANCGCTVVNSANVLAGGVSGGPAMGRYLIFNAYSGALLSPGAVED
ncbi:MAG: hypothetical protein KGR26_08480 [Cyanobacteria bacterium REEB65]|nr:hypothetical protein [Cyanobacteria bacterium REEB65]